MPSLSCGCNVGYEGRRCRLHSDAPLVTRLWEGKGYALAGTEVCACGLALVVCECGDNRCVRCDPISGDHA